MGREVREREGGCVHLTYGHNSHKINKSLY